MLVGMDVELLVVPNCPNEAVAYDLICAALTDLGVVASVRTTVIQSDEQAQTHGFIGSPTFLINGQDPFSEPGAVAAVACRMYRTDTGLAGVPARDDLREALRAGALA